MTMIEFFALLGGIGLFLYGMSIMSLGLRNAGGDNIRVILEGATKNKGRAVLVGILVTILIQSSSATDVMVIGFVNSGFMTLTQAIGIIMGANIGTTITAQITAFNLGDYAPLILFIGAVMYMFMKKDLVKHIGMIIMGFGMLFQGITLMKSAISPLAQSESFLNFISMLSNPLVTVLFGIAFTALLQSSSSATVIFQAFAMQGILDYKTSVYLIIGAAVGSVTPNILASLTTNRNGKRTALLNLLFNSFRAIILLVLLAIFPGILEICPRLFPGNVARQIANTHTAFAIITVLIMLPFTDQLVKLAMKIIPERPEELEKAEAKKLQYMYNLDNIPAALAINQVQMEIGRMGSIAYDNLSTAIDCFMKKDMELVDKVMETEDIVNSLNDSILENMARLQKTNLSEQDLNKLYHLALAVSDVERISDHAENIVEYAQMFHKQKLSYSEVPLHELKELCEKVLLSVQCSLEVFVSDNPDMLPEAERLEEEVDVLQQKAIDSHTKRLMEDSCDPKGGVIFTDMVVDLERCSDHAINIAEITKL